MREVNTTVFLFFYSITVSLIGDESRISKIVNITQGPVRGYKEPNGIFGFYNIPYATAPTGVHKFKAPLSPPSWSEIFEAVDNIIVCPQIYRNTYYKASEIQTEDCLVANVFVPDTEETDLPVVVLVHGGAFTNHFGNVLKPTTVVRNYNVIVVTFNYRLGVHGFLCLGTKNVPGNAALKDQLAALQWVNINIRAFGGNPNNVTLSGYSSGAPCVDLLALSPAATGLFNKVIVDSSVSLLVSALISDPIENAKSFAVRMGFNNTDDIYALEHFYITTPLKTLLQNDTAEYLHVRDDSTFLFTPCVERNTEDKAIKIITKSPLQTVKKGSYRQVPMFYGFAGMEGLFRLINFNEWKNKINVNFSEFLPGNLKFKDKRQREYIANKTKHFYFGDKIINVDNTLNFFDYFGDSVVKSPMFRMIKMHLEAGHDKIYLYEYTFIDDDVPIIPHTNVRGATHIAQTFAVLDGKLYDFDNAPNENNITDDYKLLKKIMRDFWANFVKTGSPVPAGSDLPAWPPVGDASLTPHMEMTLPPRLRWQWDEQLLRRMRFWDSLYKLYYREPEPPRIDIIGPSQKNWHRNLSHCF